LTDDSGFHDGTGDIFTTKIFESALSGLGIN